PSKPTPPIKSEAKEVLVTIVVRDARGHHVSGLKSSDFQVFEDGKPERIVGFGVETMAPAPARIAQGANAVQVGQSRAKASNNAPKSKDPLATYLIIVDTVHSSFANFTRVRGALSKFLEKERSTDAQYALIALGRELQLVQDSTRDPEKI